MSDPAADFDFWGLAAPWIQGFVFLALGIVGTLVVERRTNVRGDYELWVWKTATSLSKEQLGVSKDHLQYVVNGSTVAEPYEVTVDLWANGKKDIRKDLFNDRPTRVELGVPIVAQLSYRERSADETALEVDESSGTILLHPSVVRRAMAARWTFLTDGRPEMRLVDAPLDTDLMSWLDAYRGPRPMKTVSRFVGIVSLAASIGGLVLSGVLGANGILSTQQVAWMAPLTGLFFTVGLAALTFGSVAEGRRLKLARKALRGRPLAVMERGS